jgi:hypothetical protein
MGKDKGDGSDNENPRRRDQFWDPAEMFWAPNDLEDDEKKLEDDELRAIMYDAIDKITASAEEKEVEAEATVDKAPKEKKANAKADKAFKKALKRIEKDLKEYYTKSSIQAGTASISGSVYSLGEGLLEEKIDAAYLTSYGERADPKEIIRISAAMEESVKDKLFQKEMKSIRSELKKNPKIDVKSKMKDVYEKIYNEVMPEHSLKKAASLLKESAKNRKGKFGTRIGLSKTARRDLNDAINTARAAVSKFDPTADYNPSGPERSGGGRGM